MPVPPLWIRTRLFNSRYSIFFLIYIYIHIPLHSHLLSPFSFKSLETNVEGRRGLRFVTSSRQAQPITSVSGAAGVADLSKDTAKPIDESLTRSSRLVTASDILWPCSNSINYETGTPLSTTSHPFVPFNWTVLDRLVKSSSLSNRRIAWKWVSNSPKDIHLSREFQSNHNRINEIVYWNRKKKEKRTIRRKFVAKIFEEIVNDYRTIIEPRFFSAGRGGTRMNTKKRLRGI